MALSQIEAGEITEAQILELRDVDDLDAAEVYDKRIRTMEGQYKRSFIERGLILKEMEDRNLWAKLVDPATGVYWTSMDRWLAHAAPFSRSGGYDALKAIRTLTDVPVADLLDMSRCNVITLKGLSSGVRQDPEVIEAAKTLSEEAFIAKIEAEHPDQHIESRGKMTLRPDASFKKVMNMAIKAAEWQWGCQGKDAAIEGIINAWMESPCELEGQQHLSVRLAYLSSLESLDSF